MCDVSSPAPRHLKALFSNADWPMPTPPVELNGIFRHYDSRAHRVTCTLQRDQQIYEELRIRMNDFYANHQSRQIAPVVDFQITPSSSLSQHTFVTDAAG